MTFLVAATSPIAGKFVVKKYAGFGILGADIPTTGDNGGSPVLNDGINSAKEYHWRVETPPSAGVLTIYPDLTFEWDGSGVPDGSYPWVYRLFEDGVSAGTATVSQTVGITAQFLRPISDVSNSGWTPSAGSDLFACIGETVRNDSTYISATAPGAICEVLLGTSSGDPLSSINHLPRIVMSAGSGGIILRLKQGATIIKAWTYASLAGSDTLYEPTLTSGEIDAISDNTDLVQINLPVLPKLLVQRTLAEPECKLPIFRTALN